LLEVGTGFNPELTGRENVYLNGTILGMRRAEVTRKFDEIVDFAGVEKFIDTPVKRYSSGMKVRLAFAVAAHLEPEILIIDEVLAVGDFEFQAKCLGKMQDATSSGRTVLFVSHNMGAVRQLCHRTMWLTDGQVALIDETDTCVQHYLAAGESQTHQPMQGRFERDLTKSPTSNPTYIEAAELQDAQGNRCTQFSYGDEMRIVFEIGGEPPRAGTMLAWIIQDSHGNSLARASSELMCGYILKRGQRRAVCTLKHLPLSVGRYTLRLHSGIRGTPDSRGDLWSDAATFEITECDPYGTKQQHESSSMGSVIVDQAWSDL
jgi:lipopolysaccharide transport system ATP-binding protein